MSAAATIVADHDGRHSQLTLLTNLFGAMKEKLRRLSVMGILWTLGFAADTAEARTQFDDLVGDAHLIIEGAISTIQSEWATDLC